MTGTWRETLFVWKGNVELPVEGTSRGEQEPSLPFTWIGSWVGCEECADARVAATPTKQAFERSKMKFEVHGDASQQDNGHWIVSLTKGMGWHLEDQDGVVSTHPDDLHDVLMERLPSESDSSKSIIVAKGENMFGAFVSAGCLDRGGGMMLARRYLDHGDARTKWTLQQLLESVKGTAEGPDSGNHWSVRPWRSLDLHAQKLSGRKRKRHSTVAVLPRLSMPNFSPDIKFLGPHDIAAPVDWVEQCWGCGKELPVDRQRGISMVVQECTSGAQVCLAEYCTSECVIKNAVPIWVRATMTWTQSYQSTDHGLQSDKGLFWEAIESNEQAHAAMTAAGWHAGTKSYSLGNMEK